MWETFLQSQSRFYASIAIPEVLLVLFAAVIFPMAASGISNTWFSYVDQRAILSALLRSEATSAADKIESYLRRHQCSARLHDPPGRVGQGQRETASAPCLASDAPGPGNSQHQHCRRCWRGATIHLSHWLKQDGRRGGSLRRSCCRGRQDGEGLVWPGHLSRGFRTVHNHGDGQLRQYSRRKHGRRRNQSEAYLAYRFRNPRGPQRPGHLSSIRPATSSLTPRSAK